MTPPLLQENWDLTGVIGLRVPADVVRRKCIAYTQHGRPTDQPERLQELGFHSTYRWNSIRPVHEFQKEPRVFGAVYFAKPADRFGHAASVLTSSVS